MSGAKTRGKSSGVTPNLVALATQFLYCLVESCGTVLWRRNLLDSKGFDRNKGAGLTRGLGVASVREATVAHENSSRDTLARISLLDSVPRDE
jgi:hypothetical protein